MNRERRETVSENSGQKKGDQNSYLHNLNSKDDDNKTAQMLLAGETMLVRLSSSALSGEGEA